MGVTRYNPHLVDLPDEPFFSEKNEGESATKTDKKCKACGKYTVFYLCAKDAAFYKCKSCRTAWNLSFDS